MTGPGIAVPPWRGPVPLPRWPSLAASALGCVAVAVVAATFPLGSMARQLDARSVASTLVALVFAAVGWLVAVRQPRNAMGWLLLAGAVLIALNFATSYYTMLVYRQGDHLPLGAVALVLQPSWAPGIVSFGLAVLLFPDGRQLEPAHLSLWTAEITS